MEWLLYFPAFIKIAVIFALILVIYRLGIPLGLSLLINSILLSLWAGSGIKGLLAQFKQLLSPEKYLLFIVIALLLFFAELLRRTERIEKTIEAFRNWFKSTRLLLAGFPAVIGLLPMPGGALFSAPMVDSIDNRNQLNSSLKAAINYWFRHTWEYWWPLYPGVILAIKYSNLPIGTFFLIQFPLTIMTFAGGYFFLLRKIKKFDSKKTLQKIEKQALDISSVWSTFLPLSILVIISIVGSAILPELGWTRTIANLVSMLLGLGMAIAFILVSSPKKFFSALNYFYEKKTVAILILVLSVQLFSEILKYKLNVSGDTLISLMRDKFLALHIPFIIVIMIIPFISGLVTGIAVGFVGLSFPLVFAFLGNNPQLHQIVSTTVLAYGFGYTGMMLSPLHICFILTNEYFKSKLFHSYQYIIGPTIIIIISSIILSGLYYLIF